MTDTLVSADLAYMSAGALAKVLARREISSLEATDAAIARIEARDGPINAVPVRDFDRARDAARAADAALARGERGPLLGVPMTVKEALDVAGLPTTWGFEHARANGVATRDATAVARLKAAGAVVLGKTNVPVGLADWQSDNPIHGRTSNPWDLSLTSGGSSGGSAAALAAGMVHLELGSDIGGSIRVPSAFCGTFGHKPSYGLVPPRGHAPLGIDGAPVYFNVVGPMARTADDLALALEVVAGPADEDAVGYRLDLPAPRHARLGDFRVLLIDSHPLTEPDAEIRAALADLTGRLEAMGAVVARRSDLVPDLAQLQADYAAMLIAAASHGRRGAPPPAMTVHGWLDLRDAQLAAQRQFSRLFQTFDVILAPVFGRPAFPHLAKQGGEADRLEINGAAEPYVRQLAWPGLATFANLPSTAAPIGFSRAGLPIGAQIIGPYLEDRTTIAFAALLEREFGGFRPPPGY